MTAAFLQPAQNRAPHLAAAAALLLALRAAAAAAVVRVVHRHHAAALAGRCLHRRLLRLLIRVRVTWRWPGPLLYGAPLPLHAGLHRVQRGQAAAVAAATAAAASRQAGHVRRQAPKRLSVPNNPQASHGAALRPQRAGHHSCGPRCPTCAPCDVVIVC